MKQRLADAHGTQAPELDIVVIKTSGDLIQDRALAEAGGKGLFTKELDSALERDNIDLAVHSAKDLPTFLPQGIEISGYLPREDVRDAWISTRPTTRAPCRRGASSARPPCGAARTVRLRPDLAITLLRGNVETRLAKLARGEIDATILAVAGLKRLGLPDRATRLLDAADFIPAVGQGAIGITARRDDGPVAAALRPILDHATGVALACERALLQVLDGSCRTPIGGHAWLRRDHLICARSSCARMVRNPSRPRSAGRLPRPSISAKGPRASFWRRRRPASWRGEHAGPCHPAGRAGLGDIGVKLAARGHEAVLSPVAVIAPTGANWPRGTIDVLVATSARAFEALQTAPEFPTPETKRLLPLFLVGEKTLEAARSAGFTGPALAAAEVKELASKLIAHLRSYNTALYLVGRERKPDLENTCVSAGFKLTLLETYAAEAAAWLNDEALAALDADAVDAVLHYSRRSAALFLELLEAAGFDPAVLRRRC